MPPEIPPEPPVGSVLAYAVELGAKTYHYASVRAGDGRWYTTGASAAQGVDWCTVATALRAKKALVRVATEWAEVAL